MHAKKVSSTDIERSGIQGSELILYPVGSSVLNCTLCIISSRLYYIDSAKKKCSIEYRLPLRSNISIYLSIYIYIYIYKLHLYMVYFLEYYTLVSIVCGIKGLFFFFFF